MRARYVFYWTHQILVRNDFCLALCTWYVHWLASLYVYVYVCINVYMCVCDCVLIVRFCMPLAECNTPTNSRSTIFTILVQIETKAIAHILSRKMASKRWLVSKMQHCDRLYYHGRLDQQLNMSICRIVAPDIKSHIRTWTLVDVFCNISIFNWSPLSEIT